MATESEIVELVMRVRGAEAAAALSKTLEGNAAKATAARAALAGLDEQLETGVIHGTRYKEMQSSLGREIASAGKASEKSLAAAGKEAAALDKNSTFSGKYRQNITALGYALNDFASNNGNLASKLNGVANNLPMIFLGMGNFGLALSAIIPLVGLAAGSWEAFGKTFGIVTGEMQDRLATLEEKIKELTSKKHLISVEVLELANAKREVEEIKAALEAVKRLREQPAEHVKASGAAVTKAFEEAPEGGAEIEAKLRAQMIEDLKANDQEMQAARAAQDAAAARLKAAEQMIASGDATQRAQGESLKQQAERELARARERGMKRETEISKEGGVAAQQVGGLMARATEGKGGEADQAAAQKDIAKRLRAIGQTTIADDIEAHSVATLRIAEAANRKSEARMARRRNILAQMERQATEGEVEADAATKKIEEGQRAALAEIGQGTAVRAKATELQKAAKDRGLSDVETYELVMKGVYDTLKAELTKRGAAPTGRLVNEAARAAAGAAPENLRASRENQREAEKRQVAQQIAREQEIAEKSGLGRDAQLMLANLQQQKLIKGTVTVRGREQPLSDEAQFELTRRAVAQNLMGMRRNLGLTVDQVADMSVAIVAEARKKLEEARRANLAGNAPFMAFMAQMFGQPVGAPGLGQIGAAQQQAEVQARQPGAGGFRSVGPGPIPTAPPVVIAPQAPPAAPQPIVVQPAPQPRAVSPVVVRPPARGNGQPAMPDAAAQLAPIVNQALAVQEQGQQNQQMIMNQMAQLVARVRNAESRERAAMSFLRSLQTRGMEGQSSALPSGEMTA